MILGSIGMPGTGKTSKLIELLCAALPMRHPETTFRIVDSQGEFTQYGRTYRCVADYLKARTRLAGRLVRVAVFRDAELDITGLQALASDVAQLVADEGGVLVLDELPILVPPKRELPEPVARILNRGRKTPQVGLWFGAQYAADIHDRFRRAWRMLYIFRQGDENDVDWVRRNTGTWGRQMRDIVPNLENLAYVPVPRLGPLPPTPVIQHLHVPGVASARLPPST